MKAKKIYNYDNGLCIWSIDVFPSKQILCSKPVKENSVYCESCDKIQSERFYQSFKSRMRNSN